MADRTRARGRLQDADELCHAALALYRGVRSLAAWAHPRLRRCQRAMGLRPASQGCVEGTGLDGLAKARKIQAFVPSERSFSFGGAKARCSIGKKAPRAGESAIVICVTKQKKITNITVATVGRFSPKATKGGGSLGCVTVKKSESVSVKNSRSTKRSATKTASSRSSGLGAERIVEEIDFAGFGKASLDEVAVQMKHLRLDEGDSLDLDLDDEQALILVVEGGGDAALAELVSLWNLRRASAERREQIITSLLPMKVPSHEELDQLHRNAAERTRLLEDFGYYTSAQLAERVGSRAANKSQFASRLKKGGTLFAVPFRGQSLFPAFQLDSDFKPKPAIAETLRRLNQRGLKGWEVAFWFAANSSFLGGKRPLDLLDSKADLVVDAASREAPW